MELLLKLAWGKLPTDDKDESGSGFADVEGHNRDEDEVSQGSTHGSDLDWLLDTDDDIDLDIVEEICTDPP